MPVHIPPDGLPLASPMIISSSPTHLVIAFEISRAELARHRRFIQMLLRATTPSAVEDDE
jgi:hypothetical protein